jgi:hypothetical protein
MLLLRFVLGRRNARVIRTLAGQEDGSRRRHTEFH